MSFVTIGDTHYNKDNIACFGHFNSSIWIKCVGDREEDINVHSDPYKSYYKNLCRILGVLPCESNNQVGEIQNEKYNP